MAEYIDKQEFLEEQRHLYCENCAKRKGMKRGKMQFVYEIGDAPCRSCGYGDVLDDLEDFPAADVRPVVRGKWNALNTKPITNADRIRAMTDGLAGWVTSGIESVLARCKGYELSTTFEQGMLDWLKEPIEEDE